MSNEQADIPVEPEGRGQYLDIGEYAAEDRVVQSDIVDQMPELSVTDKMLREDVTRADSWLQYNKGLEQIGYSPASRLTPENIDDLSGEYTISMDTAGLETNPIVIPSDPPVMYFTEGDLTVHAVNARTGKEYWAFQPQTPSNPGGVYGVNRGVGVRNDKVYLATATSNIVAINRYTGEKQWRVSTITSDQQTMSLPRRISITETPVVFNGIVMVGQAGDSGGWTVISGMDSETGEMQWQHRTAPKDEWVGESWKFASAATWMSPAVDAESGTVIWTIANPDPMLNGMVRPGPNKYTVAIGAWDIQSGERQWITQVRAHDLWDYDMFTTPRIYDATIDGETRRLVSAEDKTGWTYAFDVADGTLVQRSQPFAKQDHEWSAGFPAYPPATEANKAEMWPGVPGGTEWPPDTYSPDTGLLYFGANNAANSVYYNPDWQYNPNKVTTLYGGESGAVTNNGHSAEVVAVDPITGQVKWSHRLQDIDPAAPMAQIWTGGTTATGGNVVFHGSSGSHLVALNAETGDLLGRANLDGRITASPVVWDDPSAGKQFVAVAADDSVVAYSVEAQSQ
jgi:alcohol dehydrogenase (cytochrome c)